MRERCVHVEGESVFAFVSKGGQEEGVWYEGGWRERGGRVCVFALVTMGFFYKYDIYRDRPMLHPIGYLTIHLLLPVTETIVFPVIDASLSIVTGCSPNFSPCDHLLVLRSEFSGKVHLPHQPPGVEHFPRAVPRVACAGGAGGGKLVKLQAD